MAFFIDDSERVEVEARGVKWQIGPVPVGKLEETELAIADARRKLDAVPEGSPERAAAVGRWWIEYAPLARELVRWGVKGWSAERLPKKTEPAQFAGKAHDVLAASVVEALARVDGGALVASLAGEVLKANRLSADDLLGFK